MKHNAKRNDCQGTCLYWGQVPSKEIIQGTLEPDRPESGQGEMEEILR